MSDTNAASPAETLRIRRQQSSAAQERWRCTHCPWRPDATAWFLALAEWSLHFKQAHPTLYRQALADQKRADSTSIARGAEGE